ncbi:hypothetical protein B9G54_02890 [Alloscardovia macacae]|uniref:DUF3800 domain-containing protein n=1 Tax=Alloscardovia macacae TaxID=1160091 RepID=A0A1Y2T1X6_9BIFI|nr:DUF3800 domain-containing protein [Alloscardovia macacae]OTA26991.1 hypothetical protein B9G54_02890 [Alloscardovia macacae]OTA30021.1 hypothetical protein B9T39_01260 [Alloscardovia macacae]
MLKAYIDESYTLPSVRGARGIYYVGSLLVDEQQDEYINRELSALRENVHRKFGIPQDAEFHGHCMFHYKDDWECMYGLHKQTHGIYKAAMRILADSGGILTFRGIRIEQGNEEYQWKVREAHGLALQHCLDRINFIGESLQEDILIIADKVEDAAAQEGRIRYIQENASHEEYEKRALANILFPFHWEDSREFVGLQMVDMALFISARAASAEAKGNDKSQGDKAVLATANIIKSNIRNSGVVFAEKQKITNEIF